ncbi:MAG TPA: Rieske 2Fe-2S domain-containing protein [Rhabdochlamydiaceae bacterium]|jgi:nitrite reductase/ring-hydroxylating ferredoxin subunit|nr:Rieske 2Fe-2S domain-containing protein [Rhabdochlamydiaceae bacterium]
MLRNYTMSSFPNGWYAVCTLEDLRKQKVFPIKSLGRDMVAFQTESGAISVLDAHCPHQGAHLGYGGTIKGETIECPFHKWGFDRSGKCQHVPYAKCAPKGKKSQLHAYPTIERLGMVVIYYSEDYSAPTWEIPQFSDDLQGNWTKIDYSEMIIKTHIQELPENGIDTQHFEPVHRSEENSIELDENQPFGPQLIFALNLVYPGGGIGRFGKRVPVRVQWRYNGLSILDNYVTLRDYPMQLRQYFFFTPLDEERVRLQMGLCINKDKIKLPSFLRYFVIKLIEKGNKKILLGNFEEDRAIWENKIYRAPPILCSEDGPITHYRRWAKQFYSQKTGDPQPEEISDTPLKSYSETVAT